MVLLAVPSTAICSARDTPAVLASPPAALKASPICSPLVRKSCTAMAVWPASALTHAPLPMASAWRLLRLYRVPT